MVNRRGIGRPRSRLLRAKCVELVSRALIGTGPAVSITGCFPVPGSLLVNVTAGLLGLVAVVTVTFNGAQTQQGIFGTSTALTGPLEGNTLTMTAGVYVLSDYTLVIP